MPPERSEDYVKLYRSLLFGGVKLSADEVEHLEFAKGLLEADAEEHYQNPSHEQALDFIDELLADHT